MRARAAQCQSVHQHKASTLGTDVFLLDIVPPSPYNAADVVHTRSSSYDHRYTVTDRDTVVRLPPPPPTTLVKDCTATTTLDDSAGPTLPARRPMTPQSPPPPPPSTSNSLSGSAYHSGVINAAFTHPDHVRGDYTSSASSRRIVSVPRPSNSHQSLSVYTFATGNGPSRSPAIPRRRDIDVDVNDGRRSTTSAGGSRPLENEYVPFHPPPPPPAAPAVSSSGATGHQNSATVNHPVVHRGPLSLSAGELNFSPPAPHLTPNQVRFLLENCIVMGTARTPW